MNRTSKYFDLRWLVEVQHPGFAGWEPMCAFNVEQVAKRYAEQCLLANPYNSYRMSMRTGRGWKVLYAKSRSAMAQQVAS